jgi:hypothetical protein
MRWLTVPVLVLVPVVAGCGGASMALDPVASAATNAEKSGAFSFDVKESFVVKGQTITISGHGVTDLASQGSQMSFDIAGLPAALNKNGTAGEAVQMGTVLYMKMPFLEGQIPGGKQWLKLDLARAAQAQGVSVGSASSFNFDPRQSLQELLASGNAKKIGTETIQGEQMTHYNAVIDPANANQVPADQRAAVEQVLKQAGISTLPVDVWVDDQGMPRQETMSLPLGKAHAEVTVDLSKFGAPVTITPPRADQVFDATQLAIKGTTTGDSTPTTTTSTTPDTTQGG